MLYFVVEMEQFGAHVHTKLVQKKRELYMKGMIDCSTSGSSAPCSWFKERAQNHFLVTGEGHSGVYREARYIVCCKQRSVRETQTLVIELDAAFILISSLQPCFSFNKIYDYCSWSNQDHFKNTTIGTQRQKYFRTKKYEEYNRITRNKK